MPEAYRRIKSVYPIKREKPIESKTIWSIEIDRKYCLKCIQKELYSGNIPDTLIIQIITQESCKLLAANSKIHKSFVGKISV